MAYIKQDTLTFMAYYGLFIGRPFALYGINNKRLL